MGKAYTDYTIGDLQRLHLSFLVKDKSPEEEKGQREAFAHIKILAATMQKTALVDTWKALEVFGDGNNMLVTDKAEINKLMFEKIHTTPAEVVTAAECGLPEVAEHKAAILKACQTNNLENRLREYKATEDDLVTNIVGASNSLERLYTQLRRARTNIEETNLLIASGAVNEEPYNEIVKMLSSGTWQFLKLEGDMLHVATTAPVVQTQVVPAHGVNRTVNFGLLRAVLNLDSGACYMDRGIGCLNYDGYYHTHVSSAGSICWGDASDRAHVLLQEKKYSEFFELLHALLTTYSADNPYRSLQGFDEKVQGATWRDERIDGDLPRDLYKIIPDIPPLCNTEAPYDVATPLVVGQRVIYHRERSDPNRARYGIVTSVGHNNTYNIRYVVINTTTRGVRDSYQSTTTARYTLEPMDFDTLLQITDTVDVWKDLYNRTGLLPLTPHTRIGVSNHRQHFIFLPDAFTRSVAIPSTHSTRVLSLRVPVGNRNRTGDAEGPRQYTRTYTPVIAEDEAQEHFTERFAKWMRLRRKLVGSSSYDTYRVHTCPVEQTTIELDSGTSNNWYCDECDAYHEVSDTTTTVVPVFPEESAEQNQDQVNNVGDLF